MLYIAVQFIYILCICVNKMLCTTIVNRYQHWYLMGFYYIRRKKVVLSFICYI
ncbi:hypothetical protein O3M35_007958 [Rhynocoris fuscipes]|uniref:Uncharacterized protein n=1 Tax=Rhynocoris fuscipes TaxID=488301 RepID=A0AAW1DDV1_9HEMI